MSPVAVDQAIALIPGMIRAWRELRFDDGVYRDHDGTLRKGLRVIEGSHPRPGVRYLVAVEGTAQPTLTAAQRDELKTMRPRPRASREERRVTLDQRSLRQREMLETNARQRVIKRYEVELREDSPERIAIVIVEPATGSTAEVSLDEPGAPRCVSLRTHGTATGSWPTKGKWTADATLDLGQLPPHSAVDPQFRGKFRHRHFRGDGHVGVHPLSRWLVYFEARVRGRGVLRPAVWLASVMFGSRVRGDLRRRLEEAPDFTGELQRRLDELRSPVSADADEAPGADRQADAALAMLLERVVEDPDAGGAL